ncbi:MAG TPA: Gfo/Idh/MocA family oxidoreductase, partial [Bryobacteraceae bacterium]|nr:Gfo/Idh/MocA family oxidoreductase [Bryobacteraceae bacterium]
MDNLKQSTDLSSRRRFLGSLTGSVAAPLIVPASALGRGKTPPSDRVTVGVIGAGTRGPYESGFYTSIEECEIVAVCDVQENRRIALREKLEKAYEERKSRGTYRGIRLYEDFRELLRQKDIDAVYIATPDHWHVAMTILAQKAGKHCHTEKPLGVSIETDLAALKAVRKYRRSFLYGAERRSSPVARHAVELVLNGRIGKVKEIYVVAPPSRSGGSPAPELAVPKGWNYDLWLGPAPYAPFCADRTRKGAHFEIRDYSLGMIANWGAHPLDQVQWWADNADMTIPVKYEGSGKIAQGGLYNCATKWDLRCTYENGLVMRYTDSRTFASVTEAPKVSLGPKQPLNNVALWVGTEGWVASAYEKVVTEPASLATSEIGPGEIHLAKHPVREERVPAGLNLWDAPVAAQALGWIEDIKAQQASKAPLKTVDPIDSAVRSDLISQLCDICIRVGHSIRWDQKKETIVDDTEAAKMMSVPMR